MKCIGCKQDIRELPSGMGSTLPRQDLGRVTVRMVFYEMPEQHAGIVCSFDCVSKALRSFADAWDAAAPARAAVGDA